MPSHIDSLADLDDYDLYPFLCAMKFDTSRACALYEKHFEFRQRNFNSVATIRLDEYAQSLPLVTFSSPPADTFQVSG